MKLTDENKEKINKMTYKQLLYKWRFAPVGDPWFKGETGEYFVKRINELKSKGVDHVKASKEIGWEK